MSRQPHSFKQNMSWAYHDIKRVSRHWIDCDLKYETKCILLEIFNGIFRKEK